MARSHFQNRSIAGDFGLDRMHDCIPSSRSRRKTRIGVKCSAVYSKIALIAAADQQDKQGANDKHHDKAFLPDDISNRVFSNSSDRIK